MAFDCVLSRTVTSHVAPDPPCSICALTRTTTEVLAGTETEYAPLASVVVVANIADVLSTISTAAPRTGFGELAEYISAPVALGIEPYVAAPFNPTVAA